jgi:hypothetical protein
MMKHSKAVFEKGIELCLNGSWYEAKNIFAQVLRDNPKDDVARHYIFLSERKLQERDKKANNKPKWQAPQGNPVETTMDRQW